MSRPRHVAIIMDGNGRWAERRGQVRSAGHERGADAVRATVRAAGEMGLEVLTLFAFSSENWQRPAREVALLMALLARYLREEREELCARRVRVVAIGDRARLPVAVRAGLAALERATAAGGAMTLCLALSYGGRQDIVNAARALAKAARAGCLDPDAIDGTCFETALSTFGLPPVDLLIRTSGEQRLSNFLLWELAYAELHFTKTPWPEFGAADLRAALEVYAHRHRRFGGLSRAS